MTSFDDYDYNFSEFVGKVQNEFEYIINSFQRTVGNFMDR